MQLRSNGKAFYMTFKKYTITNYLMSVCVYGKIRQCIACFLNVLLTRNANQITLKMN